MKYKQERDIDYEKFYDYDFISFVAFGNHNDGGSNSRNAENGNSNQAIRSAVDHPYINSKRDINHLDD